MFLDNMNLLMRQFMPKFIFGIDGDGAGDGGSGGDGGGSGDGGSGGGAFAWKGQLGADLANSPLLGKFPDTVEGLQEAFKSHVSLEKLLGHEKVPLPKGPDDVEGRKRFNAAIGVPESIEGYKLADVQIPESMKGMMFDKNSFLNIMHANHITPGQAEGLWNAYTEMSMKAYQNEVTKVQETIDKAINALRMEWGDAYTSKIQLSDLVIKGYAGDQETADWLTATLAKDPRGMKFLAKIGEQFSENKIGEFKFKQLSMTPADAQAEIDKITSDPNHPYLNQKASAAEHQAAVEYVNRLYAIVNKKG